MSVIALAATKGGAGKTTLAAALACAVPARTRAALIDLDPQQSTTRWHERREALRPALIPKRGRHADAALAEAAAWDVTLIDCPPGSIATTTLAVRAADIVVIPARPSPLDVEALGPLVELCRREGKPFGFVLNALGPRSANSSLIAGARSYLSSFDPEFLVPIADRRAYAAAMLTGETGPEQDAAAATEVAALWAAINRAIRRSA